MNANVLKKTSAVGQTSLTHATFNYRLLERPAPYLYQARRAMANSLDADLAARIRRVLRERGK